MVNMEVVMPARRRKAQLVLVSVIAMSDTSIVLTMGLETYLVFIALQCLAAPLAVFLSPPEKASCNFRDEHGVFYLILFLNRSNEAMEVKLK